jgi:hypothetical protein
MDLVHRFFAAVDQERLKILRQEATPTWQVTGIQPPSCYPGLDCSFRNAEELRDILYSVETLEALTSGK